MNEWKQNQNYQLNQNVYGSRQAFYNNQLKTFNSITSNNYPVYDRVNDIQTRLNTNEGVEISNMLKRGPAVSGSKNINTVDSNNVNNNDDFNFLKNFERKV